MRENKYMVNDYDKFAKERQEMLKKDAKRPHRFISRKATMKIDKKVSIIKQYLMLCIDDLTFINWRKIV